MDAKQSAPAIAQDALTLVGTLFAIEANIKGADPRHAPKHERNKLSRG